MGRGRGGGGITVIKGHYYMEVLLSPIFLGSQSIFATMCCVNVGHWILSWSRMWSLVRDTLIFYAGVSCHLISPFTSHEMFITTPIFLKFKYHHSKVRIRTEYLIVHVPMADTVTASTKYLTKETPGNHNSEKLDSSFI